MAEFSIPASTRDAPYIPQPSTLDDCECPFCVPSIGSLLPGVLDEIRQNQETGQ